ncbi:proline-rich protein 1 [Silene latifolia]|uniref:proline-rich protein 1 n=1 Tax=Silene latifolia TaxID=37657 RepID=UPI003D78AF64
MATVTVTMTMIMVILGCSLLLIKGTLGAMNENEVIHIGGKVMCQDCSQGWNDWVQGSNPIKGSTVSVTCLDERKRVVCYKSDKTDEDGEFSMVMEKMVHGKKLNPKNCIVRLVSSPDPSCNVATNFAQGKTGVKLRQPSVVYRDITKYRLGPFYYTTPACACSDDDISQ